MALKPSHHSEKVSLYQQWQPQHRIWRRYRWYFPQKRTAAKGIFSPELMMTSSWSHSSEGVLPLTRPSHSWVPLVSWLLHSIFSPRALLCYTRHFRLWQLRHLPESILFNSSPSSLAGSVHLGHPWFRGVPPSAEEMLSTLSILPCFVPRPSFWPSSLWLALLSCLLFLAETEHELFGSVWVKHRTHLGIILTHPHFPGSLSFSYGGRHLMNN